MKTKLGTLLVASLLFLMNCSGPSTFINKEADWTFYKKIGLLPFVNLSPDRFAGEKVQSAFVTELYLSSKFDVVEPGEFNARVAEVLKATGAQITQDLSAELIKAIGEKAGVQGIIAGTVREFTTVRIGQTDYPLISLSVRLIDVPTGTVVWMTSHTEKGGPNMPIISIGETHTLGELTQKISHDIVSQFIGKAF